VRSLGQGKDQGSGPWSARSEHMKQRGQAIGAAHADFWQVTGDALDFSLETLLLDQPGLGDRLMELYLTLDTFPEVPDVLRQLKAAGLKTAILSNGTPAMPGSMVYSIWYCRSKGLASTNRILESTSSRSID
jgi:hypothetical protein